jgi:hypothetical protein
MIIQAVRFEILRDVEANGRRAVALAEMPRRVCTLIDDAEFERDRLMIHNETVFFEDRHHDWSWRAGKLFFYTRVATRADVLVVYEETVFAPAPPGIKP